MAGTEHENTRKALIQTGLDEFGDPALRIYMNSDRGGEPGGISADEAEELAVGLLQAVAHTRAVAAIFRSLVMDGMDEDAAHAFILKHMQPG